MKTRHAINHFPGREQRALSQIKNVIVSRYHPLLIYYISSSNSLHTSRSCFQNFKNHQRWFFNCDLLVIMPDGATLPESAAQELESLSKEYSRIRLITHPLSYVIQQMQAYSLFFQWIRHRGIILFERDGVGKILPEPVENMKQYRCQAEQFFKECPDYHHYKHTQLLPLPGKTNTITADTPIESTKHTQQFTENLIRFLNHHDPQDIKGYIRTVLLGYLQAIDGNFPPDFDEVLLGMKSLADIFDQHKQHFNSTGI